MSKNLLAVRRPSFPAAAAAAAATATAPTTSSAMTVTAAAKGTSSGVDSSATDRATKLYELGLRYQAGEGVEKDLQIAFEMFQLAADRNHIAATFSLGLCFENGKGVEKNEHKAFECYNKGWTEWFVLNGFYFYMFLYKLLDHY